MTLEIHLKLIWASYTLHITIGGVMVIMVASSVVDRGSEPRSGQTEDCLADKAIFIINIGEPGISVCTYKYYVIK
jgi:5-keto 4-deoxyuronate isomerase